MNRKLLFIVGIVIAISSCTAMNKLTGMGVVTQEISTFDNATIIEVSPNFLYDPGSTWGTAIQLGARWSSAAPDSVALILSYRSNVSSGSAYLNFSGLKINIDGTISSYSTGQPTNLSSSAYNTVTHTIYTSSENSIVVPYSVLESMVAAKDCRLRINTVKGYQDVSFSTEHFFGGSATAIVSIKEFMSKVADVRGNRKE